MAFEDGLAFTLSREGGLVHDPLGGLTNRGVTQSAYDAFRRDNHLAPASVETLAFAELTAFYLIRFWLSGRCDVLSSRLGQVHFDTAVNLGVEGAVRALQCALGVAPDGILGSVTLAAIRQRDEDDLIYRYLDLRETHYRELARRGKEQASCLAGWLARVDALRSAVSPS